jgi:hypothetical protein
MVTDSSESVSNYLDSSGLHLPPKLPDLHPAIFDTGTTGHFDRNYTAMRTHV